MTFSYLSRTCIRFGALGALVTGLVACRADNPVAPRTEVAEVARLRPTTAKLVWSAWTASGSGTVTVANDGTHGSPSMTYNQNGDGSYSGGNWRFQTTALTTGTVELPWSYVGCHSWYMSQAVIWSFVTHDGNTTETLVGSTGGCLFAMSGTETLNVQAGDTYGFRLYGYHFDWSQLLGGTLTIVVPIVDSDDDGVPDAEDAFPNDPNETADTDLDGVGDNADAFPSDPTETLDSDHDGVGNNADAFPYDPAESVDSDHDGVGNNADAFPYDPAESADSDHDGIGDNADAVDDSNLSPTVFVGACNSGVGNQVLSTGATFNDLIVAAAAGAANHGQFVSNVTNLSNGWKKAGLISGKDHGAITSCAARSK